MTPLLPVQAGGAQAFVIDLATGLTARGHELTLYCSAGSLVPGVRLVEIPVDPGVRRGLFRSGGDPPAAVPELRAGFERLFDALRRSDPDGVSQHAFDAEAIELAAGLPVIHTLHLPPTSAAVVAAAVASEARFATVSEAARLGWAAAGVAAEVLPNGVPDWPIGTQPVQPRALLAGRIAPEKGIEDGIAAATLAGLQAHVVGGDYDAEYRARLAGADIHPAVSRRELRRLMAASAVTLMPVKWEEPFGLVAAEAQLAGCPVAAYARGALPEVVRDGAGGYLAPPGDVAGLAAAIGRCLTLDRAAVREQALTRFSMERSLDAYETALVEL